MVDIKSDVRFNPIKSLVPNSAAIAVDVANISIADTISSIGQSITSHGLNIKSMNDEYKRQAKEADDNAVYANQINEATIQYQNLFQQRINETVDQDGNPTYGTLQNDVAQIGLDVLNERLSGIDSPEVRARFQQNFSSYTGNQQIGSISIARNQQQAFISESITNSVSELGTQAGGSNEQNRVFFERQVNQILNEGVASGSLTPVQRGQIQEDFRREVSIATLRNAINEDPVIALDMIKNNSAEDLKLTELERLSMQREAQVAATRLLTGRENLNTQQQKYIRDQLNNFEKIINFGQQIPQDAQDEMNNIIVGSGFEERFKNLMRDSGVINAFTMENPITRQTILNDLNSNKELTLDQLELRKKLSTIDNGLNNKINNDVFSLAIEQGIVDNPEQFDPNGDISSQLKERQASTSFTERHYQTRTSGLTKSEMNGFIELYSDSTYEAKAKLLGGVVEGMGDNAYSFLEDMAKTGSTNAAAIGSLMVEGDNATAVTVLKGQDIIKNNPSIIPADYREIESTVKSNSLPFYNLAEQENDVVSMAKSYYAALTSQEHDFSIDTNQKRLEESMSAVSNGGAISFNSSNIEPPVNGMSANEFKKWIRNLTSDDINKSGGLNGFNNESLTRNIRNSSLISNGRGRYIVYLTDGFNVKRPVLNNSGEAFVLDYNIIEGSAREPIQPFDSSEVSMGSDDYLQEQGFR